MTKININLQKEYNAIEKYEAPLNYRHKCPVCGSSETVRNGTYVRNAVYIKRGKLSVRKIRLQRFLCKDCKRTRTHYPEFIVPGREYCLQAILYICSLPVGRNVLEKTSGVPISQIRKLRMQYRQVRKRIKTIIAEKAEISISDLVSGYMKIFKKKPFEGYQRDVTIITPT